jgi:pimeloyl-ACP methyl ester carboxylesterase
MHGHRPLLWMAIALGLATALLGPPHETAGQAPCQDGVQPSGAIYRICMPANWNGNLVVWAHGYVDPREPIAIPEGQFHLPDGTSLIDIATGLDYAFATTSYRYNGLAAPWGVADVVELTEIFEQRHGPAERTFLVGASEGAFITALALENYPEVFDGGIAACGPIGDFRQQVNYFGDFRVVFDYFFPGVIPGEDVIIPQEVIDSWESVYVPAIRSAIASDPHATQQLLRVTHAPTDPAVPASIEQTILGLLWYNAHATNDAIAKLHGSPFDNMTRAYSGSENDAALNSGVRRFAADPVANLALDTYFKTTGDLESPLVTLHTKGDPIVPAWHEQIYKTKALVAGSLFNHYYIPIDRYGHCNFQPIEALISILVLNFLVFINSG